MQNEKPISSLNESYNNLRQNPQKSSYLDIYNINNFEQPQMKKGQPGKEIVPTQDYLATLEQKYEKQYRKEIRQQRKSKKYQNSSSSSYDSFDSHDSYTKIKAPSAVPKKFTQKSVVSHQMQQPNIIQEFHFPQGLSLSRGVSERIVQSVRPSFFQEQPQQQEWQVLDQISKQYDNRQQEQSAPPSIIQSSITKSMFFEIAQNIKQKLPENHKGRQKLVAQLYSLCLKQNIQEKQWDNWIQQQLLE